MKYIMYQHNETRQRIPIIFPSTLVHALVDESLRKMYPISQSIAISAGEINLTLAGEIYCYGESSTMKLKSLEKLDADVIRRHDYFFGL